MEAIGNPKKEQIPQGILQLMTLALPLVVSFSIRSIFTFVDTIYASFLGDDAIAAIGLAMPFEFVMIAIWVGASTGLTSHISKGIVSSDPENDYNVFIRAAWKIIFCIIPAFMLFAILLYFLAPYANLEQGVIESFQIYAVVLLLGSSLTGFWSIIPDSIVKAHHDTRSTMIAGLISNFLNLGFNTLFLFVFHWGLFGIAFSTVISRFGGLSYAIHRARALEKTRLSTLQNISAQEGKRSDSEALILILKLAIPSALTYSLMSAENLVMNAIMARLPNSTSAIAAYGIYYRIMMFAVMPMIATTVAVLPFIARLSNNSDSSIILKNFRDVMIVSLGYVLLIVFPVGYLFSHSIVELLTDTTSMISYGSFALKLVPWMCLVAIPFLFAKPVLEGLQKPKPIIILSLLRYGALSIPLSILGAYFGLQSSLGGFYGAMYGLFAAASLTSIAAFLFTRRVILK